MKYIIEMPGGWEPGECAGSELNTDCPVNEYCTHPLICPLSHAVSVKEQGEAGLWEELEDFTAGICPTELADDIRNTLEDILYRHTLSHAVLVDEPKDCGYTLATCPYERCSGITKRADKAEEPLAVLCERLGYRMRWSKDDGRDMWHISLRPRRERWIPKQIVHAPTYAECEAKARAWLEELK